MVLYHRWARMSVLVHVQRSQYKWHRYRNWKEDSCLFKCESEIICWQFERKEKKVLSGSASLFLARAPLALETTHTMLNRILSIPAGICRQVQCADTKPLASIYSTHSPGNSWQVFKHQNTNRHFYSLLILNSHCIADSIYVHFL